MNFSRVLPYFPITKIDMNEATVMMKDLLNSIQTRKIIFENIQDGN